MGTYDASAPVRFPTRPCFSPPRLARRPGTCGNCAAGCLGAAQPMNSSLFRGILFNLLKQKRIIFAILNTYVNIPRPCPPVVVNKNNEREIRIMGWFLLLAALGGGIGFLLGCWWHSLFDRTQRVWAGPFEHHRLTMRQNVLSNTEQGRAVG